MPFPRRLLNETEDIVLDLRPHWWIFAAPAAALGAAIGLAGLVAVLDLATPFFYVVLALVVLALLWMGGRWARWATTNFVLTTDRLIYR
ncbi:MAG: PH domain-containing protein, partial [Acidimicrobiales bacterium]